ncbi:MAG: hypothetical protein D6798_09010 [Deltaproteobacteria bacterium]|nr:MAG: hypothetical protein D6798_09010 [Deltaproteobacteria bacterium]
MPVPVSFPPRFVSAVRHLPPLGLMVLAAGTGCTRSQPLPDLGDCAIYPDGTYTYGQVGIGTCLAGPAALSFVDNGGDPVLLVTNANHLGTFTGGSMLAIPWSAVDLGQGRNVIGDLGAEAVDLPSFAGGFDVWDKNSDGQGDLALVASRESDEARTRAWPDEVWLVDITDPTRPALADAGPDGGSTVTVGSDPVDVAVDEASGRAFVVNRTSHSVSILDVTGDPVDVVLPWPEQVLTEGSLDDRDGSGSTGEMTTLELADTTLVPDEDFTLTWVDGTWRVWLPEEAGLRRTTTTGGGTYTDSNLGTELSPDDAAIAIDAIADPALLDMGDVLAMYFSDNGGVYVALSDSALAAWAVQTTPALSASEGDEWDAVVHGPEVVYGPDDIAMFYGATDGSEGAISQIGRATSSDGLLFSRTGDPVIVPTWDHELGGVDDPTVWYDSEIGLYRMAYGAFDGERWTIGHAVSTDLDTWTSDPEPLFEVPGVDVAAPVVAFEPGMTRMWYARDDGTGWVVAEATSPDGRTWTETGVTLALDGTADDGPPGPAVQAAIQSQFRLNRESTGELVGQVDSGTTVSMDSLGFLFGVVSGYHAGTDTAGAASANGITVDSVDPATGRAWFTLTDEGGTPAIGTGTVDGLGNVTVDSTTALVGTESYEDHGVTHPTVVATADGYVMLYAARQGEVTTIARATSTDGLSWTRTGEVLVGGTDWDSVELVPGSVVIQDDGSWRLFYSGSDGETWRIGEAVSTDQGMTWTRDGGTAGYSFTTGSPGEWDDSGVRDPFAMQADDGSWQLWYAGFDGDAWAVGYATRASLDDDFVRFEDPITGDKRAVIRTGNDLFHPDGVLRPVVLSPDDAAALGGTDNTWQIWYAGRKEGVDRVGRATGLAPDALHRIWRRPTTGDTLTFQTQRGDPDQLWIPLDATVGESNVTAVGVASLAIDSERGFLYVVSKNRPYIFVIDIRDDSPLPDGSADLNYLDIEAVIAARNASGAAGFRQVLPVPGSDRLLAINDSPDAVWEVDISDLEDRAFGEVLYDDTIGWVTAPRGSQRDEGVDTQGSVGVGRILLHPDGRRLFVTNFNANSIGVVDLDLGPYGTLTDEVMLVGENPFAMALSPDDRFLVFGNYNGEVSEDGVAESTLGVLDVDEDSPTYLEVLTWITNR